MTTGGTHTVDDDADQRPRQRLVGVITLEFETFDLVCRQPGDVVPLEVVACDESTQSEDTAVFFSDESVGIAILFGSADDLLSF